MTLQQKTINNINQLTQFLPSLEKPGQKNLYNCRDCGFTIVTINSDYGTTPLKTNCLNCDKIMQSKAYEVNQDITPSYEWYRPNESEILTITDETLLAFLGKGGLLLRKKQ